MKIALIGDTALFGRFCLEKNPSALSLLDKARSFLSKHDVVIANLETPLCYNLNTYGAKSAYIRSNPENVEILKYLGVTHVTLANNHIGDFGVDGCKQTQKTLEKSGIDWFGIGQRQVYLENKGSRVALLGYCAYNTNPIFFKKKSVRVNPFEVNQVISDLSVNSDKGYLSILAAHSGQEHIHMPSLSDIHFARSLAKKFNYIYYGHHPHVIQGFESASKSLIFYSLGNFLFDDVYTPYNKHKPLIKLSNENKTGLIASITIKDSIIESWNTTPVYLGKKSVLIGKPPHDFNIDDINSYLIRANQSNYTNERQESINTYLDSRKSLRNLKWYLKRFNLNSIKILMNANKNKKLQKQLFDSHLELLI